MPTGNLPAAGKKIWEEVHDKALKGSCKGDEECAARTAWSAVKGAGWHKDKDGQWVHKAELEEFSLTIKNLFVDQKTQEKRWKADTSDTVVDSRGDNMTTELFKSFLSHINNKDLAPEEYRSEFWQGGMPYLSVSHYSDFNGKGVPGPVENVYIDGRFFKAKGKFNDDKLGNAAWKALLADKESDRPDKIRISIGFLDFGHIHKSNNYAFKRNSLDDVCPECIREHLNGENSGRSFTDGMLVHLAMTRVPVNKRTSIAPDDEMEVKSDMTTQLEDAKSIIGDEAEELEALKKELSKKSELVEFSEIDKAAQTCPKCGENVTPTSDGKCPECGADMESPTEDSKEPEEESCATDKKKMKAEFIEEKSELDQLKQDIQEIKALLTKTPEPEVLDEVQKSELYPSIQDLVAKFSEVVKSDLPEQEKLRMVQEPFNKLADVMVEQVKKSVVKEPVQDAPVDMVKTLSEALSNVMSPVVQKLDMLLQSQTPSDGRIPPRRSLMPSEVVPKIIKSDTEQEAAKSKPKAAYSITEIANRSAGLQ